MKKKIYFLMMFCAMTLFATSCMEVDNFDEPEGVYRGVIIDKTTGEPILASQGECHVRILEKSYSLNPSPLDIPVKQDGNFQNIKLFNGTYDVELRGAWWPLNEQHRVGINTKTPADRFEVVPYLHIIDFSAEYDEENNELVMSCRLEAPIEEGLPNVRSVRPFLSLTQFCGANQCISEYSTIDDYKADMNTAWDRIKKAEDGNSEPYEFHLPVKKGYHYFVRMGAYVDDEYHCYNYSEIKEIIIPD